MAFDMLNASAMMTLASILITVAMEIAAVLKMIVGVATRRSLLLKNRLKHAPRHGKPFIGSLVDTNYLSISKKMTIYIQNTTIHQF